MSKHDGMFKDDNNPLWYKDAIIYELHVRGFCDSDGDGIGDFAGLTQKLDYLQDLGITAIWLLPFYPSPLRDDGYDIADYNDVNPIYGSLRDFKTFVREAHKRGLRVITELVCNHTSDQHPWFQRARKAKEGSSHRNFYVWSDTDDRYKETRIIFKDFESSNWTWDPEAAAYFWHRFYRHQPDLNFENPRVQKELFKVIDYWLQMGVDGMRLDAVPYLYEREGTNCENLEETHNFLKDLRRHVDAKFVNRMLLAEANQWPEDAVSYFGNGDECHMAFHFPLMPRLFMSIYMENRFPIIDILKQTPDIPNTAQWALFLRNHDELTLEMVTDEERDYMYRIYASDHHARINLGIRRRLAPLLSNNRRRIELMNGLLFSLPGTPVIYYGDEIGMGDNIYLGDRDGVRTPMQWSPDRNAGFSTSNRQRLYLPVIIDPEYHYEAINVETQQSNPSSLLWWMKRLIALRKRYKAFGRGSIEFLNPENRKVLAFLRRYGEEMILVVANLSRFSQGVELDLSELNGMVPVEMFGRTAFPPIGDLPYFITLGPHNFFMFSLETQRVDLIRGSDEQQLADLPALVTRGAWRSVFRVPNYARLAEVLPQAIKTRRWFGGKARTIRRANIVDIVPLNYDGSTAYTIMMQVEYTEGMPETYVVPLAYAEGEDAAIIQDSASHTLIAAIRMKDGGGVLYDALSNPSFCRLLLESILQSRRIDSEQQGTLIASLTQPYRTISVATETIMDAKVVRGEQSNTSVIFGDKLILKLFRRIDQGINPDLEICRFLTEKTSFTQIAPVVGSIEYSKKRSDPVTLAMLQEFVPNEGDAWEYTLDVLQNYLEEILSAQHEPAYAEQPIGLSLLNLAEEEIPPMVAEVIGPYIESARVLGKRTAEMHVALCSDWSDPNFAPERFTSLYQRSLYQSMRNRAGETFVTLRNKQWEMPEHIQPDVSELVVNEDTLIARFQSILAHKISTMRTRIHGDYHLGQVLFTGNDFVIIDFEGEPARSLAERRMKRSPLTDVAGMIRSFDYAVHTALSRQSEFLGIEREEDHALQALWGRFWYQWICAVFIKEYLQVAEGAPFIPDTHEELFKLLEVYILDKAVYELGYELNNRPNWVHIPVQSILNILKNS